MRARSPLAISYIEFRANLKSATNHVNEYGKLSFYCRLCQNASPDDTAEIAVVS